MTARKAVQTDTEPENSSTSHLIQFLSPDEHEDSRRKRIGVEIYDGTRASLQRRRSGVDGRKEINQILHSAFLLACDSKHFGKEIQISDTLKISVTGLKPMANETRDYLLQLVADGNRTGEFRVHLPLNKMIEARGVKNKPNIRQTLIRELKNATKISVNIEHHNKKLEQDEVFSFKFLEDAVFPCKKQGAADAVVAKLCEKLMYLFDAEGFRFDWDTYASLEHTHSKNLYLQASMNPAFRNHEAVEIPPEVVGIHLKYLSSPRYLADLTADMMHGDIQLTKVGKGKTAKFVLMK